MGFVLGYLPASSVIYLFDMVLHFFSLSGLLPSASVKGKPIVEAFKLKRYFKVVMWSANTCIKKICHLNTVAVVVG